MPGAVMLGGATLGVGSTGSAIVGSTVTATRISRPSSREKVCTISDRSRVSIMFFT